VRSSVPGDEPGVLVPAAEAAVPVAGGALPGADPVPVAVLVAVFVAAEGAGPAERAVAGRLPHGDDFAVLSGLPLALGSAVVAVPVPPALPGLVGLTMPDGLVAADDCGVTLGLAAAVDVAPDGLAFGDAARDEAAVVFGAPDERGAGEEHEADAAGLERAALPPAADAALPMTWPGPPRPGTAPLPAELVPDSAVDTPVTSTVRSGGTASAIPMANSAHATPSAGRSSD
jgi:hypothetical protein